MSTGSGCPDFLLAAARVKLRRGTAQANALFNLVTDLGNLDEKDLACPVAQAQQALVAATLNVDDTSVTLDNLDTDVATCPVFQPLMFDFEGWSKSDTVSRFHRAQQLMARATADSYFKTFDGARKDDSWQTLQLAFSIFTTIKRIGFSSDVQTNLDDLATAMTTAGNGQDVAVTDYQAASGGVLFTGVFWVPEGAGVMAPLLQAIEAMDTAVTDNVKTLLTGKVPQLPAVSPRSPSPIFNRLCAKCDPGS